MTEQFEVAEYMVGSLDASRHPALLARPGSGIIFDGKTKRWALESTGDDNNALDYDDIYRQCFDARDELLATSNKYQKKLKQPTSKIETTHSWTEVEGSLQTTCAKLDELATKDKSFSGKSGKFKKAFRGLCQNAGAGNTFTSVVPNDSFSSVLCGGLKVIFTGLQQTGFYREEIYKALEEVPFLLSDHAASVKLFNHDEELHRRTASLYVSVYKLLNHILLWFVRNAFVTGIKLAIDPIGFKERLKERLADVKISAQRFESHALRLSRQSQDESLQLQYWATYQQAQMHHDVQTILDRTQLLEERMARAHVLEKLDPFLLDALKEKNIQHQSRLRKQKLLPDISIQDILERFRYEPDMLVDDCNVLKKQLKHTRRDGLDISRLTALQSNPRLRAWLIVDEPSLLLLNGRAKPRHDSEVSLFSAKLMESLLDKYDAQDVGGNSKVAIVPLAFFCGQHQDWYKDPNGNVEELGMSLLLQLIERYGNFLEPKVLRRCYNKTTPGDIDSICASLTNLLTALPPNIFLFIVVDGLKYFSQPSDRLEKIRHFVEHLVSIYRNGTAATLKMLFASPVRSDFIEDLFDEDELLDMPQHLKMQMPLRQQAYMEPIDVEELVYVDRDMSVQEEEDDDLYAD